MPRQTIVYRVPEDREKALQDAKNYLGDLYDGTIRILVDVIPMMKAEGASREEMIRGMSFALEFRGVCGYPAEVMAEEAIEKEKRNYYVAT